MSLHLYVSGRFNACVCVSERVCVCESVQIIYISKVPIRQILQL